MVQVLSPGLLVAASFGQTVRLHDHPAHLCPRSLGDHLHCHRQRTREICRLSSGFWVAEEKVCDEFFLTVPRTNLYPGLFPTHFHAIKRYCERIRSILGAPGDSCEEKPGKLGNKSIIWFLNRARSRGFFGKSLDRGNTTGYFEIISINGSSHHIICSSVHALVRQGTAVFS